MKTHLANSTERKHYIVKKASLPNFKVQAIYTGVYSTHNTVKPQTHKHNFYEVMLITNDDGDIYIDEKQFKVQRGNVVLYPPGAEHCETASPGKNLKSIFFAVRADPVLTATVESAHLPFVLDTGNDYRKFKILFETLLNESQNHAMSFHDEVSSCLCEVIILEMLHLSTSNSILKKVNESFLNVKEYIDAHFTENIMLKDMCKELFVSKYYVSRLFKEHMSITPMRYVVELRLEYAKKLLTETDMPVAEIASAVGYEDTYHFSKLFKKEEGISPKFYRNKARNRELDEMPSDI